MKHRQINGKMKKDKRQTMINITLHREVKIQQHEYHSKMFGNSVAPRRWKFLLH